MNTENWFAANLFSQTKGKGIFMKKHTKKLYTLTAAAAVVFGMSITAFAGQWRSDALGWWWQNDNGSFPVSCWQWIDGNNDGLAECYYFNENGYCLLNTMTSDGYFVNESGAWIIDGIVQIQWLNATVNNSIPQDNSAYVNADETIEYNGHTYHRIDEDITWHEAKEFCENMGGHLATITSKEEQEAIESLIKNGTQKQYWLGGYNDGGWKWVTGEKWSYTHWASGEPNGYRNNESFAQIYRLKNPKRSSSFGQWNDISADNYIYDETNFFSTEYVGIICEIEP